VVSGAGQVFEGLRVVELADAHAEWCGKLFADMGADVIKVEPPGGAPTRRVGPFVGDEPESNRSLFFWHYNTSKQSVTLDLEQEKGRSLLRLLLADADVFLETLTGQEKERLGLDYATLSAANPRLIHVSVTPFGQDGPYVEAGYRTTDLVTMALGGPMQSCGYDVEDGDLPPVRPGPHHSYHTASNYAHVAALVALWERETSGLGQFIDVSAQAALAVTVEFAATHWEYDRAILRRQTGRHAGRTPTARTQYICADGEYVNLGVPRDAATWEKLLAYLQSKGLAADLDAGLFQDPERRMQLGGAIMGLLEVLTANLTSEEMFHLGQSLGLTWGAVRAPEDWLDDAHARARSYFAEVHHPELGGSLRYPGAPYCFGASPWRLRARAPRIGEHTAEVLAGLGLSQDEVPWLGSPAAD
jgi:crotonobetainyl-CoA:carnitine CoA-transferase CaiB-like acyl-CoA transferase